MKRKLAATLVIALTTAAVHAREATLRAGAATSNISPWLGLSINGGMSDRIASSIHDELHARCLVLESGGERLAIVVCDSCMIPREIFDEAKRRAEKATGIPADRMLLSATHTHSAPAACGVFQSEADPDYRRFLARKIGDAVARAAGKLAPAKLGWGTGRLPQHVFNRRWFMKEGAIPADPFGRTTDRVRMNPPRGSPELVRPAGPTDPQVLVLSVRALDGAPIALVANYALHYVGGVGGGQVSADYFGAFAGEIERELGGSSGGEEAGDRPAFVAMLSNGASGNINNIDFRVPAEARKPYEQIRRVASDLAREVLRVEKTIEYRDRVELASRQSFLRLGVRRPDEEELRAAGEILAGADAPDLSAREQIYARESKLLAAYPGTVELTLQTLRIGDLSLAAIPCEVFVEIGLAIRAASPFRGTAVFALANGYNGYLPTVEHHRLGGYETWRARSSYLEVEAAPKIVEVILAQIADLHPTATERSAARGPAWIRHTIDDSSRGADGTRLADANGDGLPDIATGWEEGGVVRVYLNPGAERSREPWPAVTVGRVGAVEDAVLADLDGDGRLDVVSSSEGVVRAMHLHWAPAGPSSYLDADAWKTEVLPASAGQMAWMFCVPAQIDGRAGVDLVAAGKGSGAALGWFEAPEDPRELAGWKWHPLCDVGWIMSIVLRDMDGDGDRDILASDRKGPSRGCFWLENPGAAESSRMPWKRHGIGGERREVMFLTVAESEEDGDDGGVSEVIVALRARELLELRRGSPASTAGWSAHSIALPPDIGTGKSVAVGDLDLDGRNEIVVTCENAVKGRSGVIYLSRSGDGWSARELSGPRGVKFDLVRLLDLDGDGDLDVLSCEEREGLGVFWYENPLR